MQPFLKTGILCGLVLGLLSACGKPDSGSQGPGTNDVESAASAAEPAPRPATFDPNLQPKNIVWDDPQKQREWEARQREAASR